MTNFLRGRMHSLKTKGGFRLSESAWHRVCFNIDLALRWKQASGICFERQVDAGSAVKAWSFWRVKSEQHYSTLGKKKGSTGSFVKKQKISCWHAGFISLSVSIRYSVSWRPASEQTQFYASLTQRKGAAASPLWEKGSLKNTRLPCDKEPAPLWVTF